MIDFSGMFFYLAVSAFTPGPNNLMCMYLGANYGLRGSRKFITASMASVFAKALLCGLLNVALARFIPTVVPVMKWVDAPCCSAAASFFKPLLSMDQAR